MIELPPPTTDDRILSVYRAAAGTLSREDFDRHLLTFRRLMVRPFAATDVREQNRAGRKWSRYAHAPGLDDTEAERILFAFDNLCPLRPPRC